MPDQRAVSLVTLGCGRNEADSEELAGRLEADGWRVVADATDADAVVVNTCGFIEAAKKDSIDTLLQAADLKSAPGDRRIAPRAVVAVGCLAERYGGQLAASMPEVDAVLGFDDYPSLSARLDDVLAGRRPVAHQPRDRRRLLPLAPAERAVQPAAPDLPAGIAPASGPRPVRRRLDGGPVAPLKLASGCDRRCAFCAIPSFRGAFASRPPADVLAEAQWLAEQGVRELVLVSENSTSYGKDLGNLRLLEALLPDLAAIPGIVRVRVAYLQPAELRPSLVSALATTPGVAPYFDLSFQHASAPVLRRMRRFGDTARFLALLDSIRQQAPAAGMRSNVIVGFPGETRADVGELVRFLSAARLDAIGVFGYSDEDGTEAVSLPAKVAHDAIARRLARVTALAEELTAQRAEERIGTEVEVLVESVESGGRERGASAWAETTEPPVLGEGRAAHQAPDVDGTTRLRGETRDGRDGRGEHRPQVGDLVRARVVAAEGVDLVADVLAVVDPARTRRTTITVSP